MELIFALIIARFIVNGTVDVTSMITGNQPPSKTYRDAKGENKEDGPLTRAIKAWWADAIEDIDEAKKIRRLESKEEKSQERERRRAERQAWIDDMNRKIEEEKRRQEEEREGRRKTWKWTKDPKDLPPLVIDEVDEEPEAERPPVETIDPGDPPVVDETVTGEIDPDEAEAETPVIFDADIVADENSKAIDPPAGEAEGIDPGPPEGPEIPELKVIDGGRPDSDEWSVYGKPNLYAVQDVNTQKDAGTGIEAGGTNMTTVAAVEGGISAHIEWTAQMAEYQIRAAAHAEIVGATMFRGDNGPARVAMLRRLQEAHNMLREAYLEVNAVLINDKRLIGDAYAATGNQAGDKRYTTN